MEFLQEKKENFKMTNQRIWFILLVVIHLVSNGFCESKVSQVDRSDLLPVMQRQNATRPFEEDIHPMASSPYDVAQPIFIIGSIVIGSVIFLVLCCCIVYRCTRRCGKQTKCSGLILPSNPYQQVVVMRTEQPIVMQYSPHPTEDTAQHPLQQTQAIQHPQYQLIQQFPPHYQPAKQLSSLNQTMQQYPPNNQFAQQYSPNSQPLQQSSPNSQPERQYSPNNQSIQQYSPNNQSMQQNSPNNQSMQQNSPNNQSMQQHSPNNQLMQQSTMPQFETPQEFSNFPEKPPLYQDLLPDKS